MHIIGLPCQRIPNLCANQINLKGAQVGKRSVTSDSSTKHFFKLQSYIALAEIHPRQLKEEPHSTACDKQWWTYDIYKMKAQWMRVRILLNNPPKLHGYRKTANCMHKHQPTLVQDTATCVGSSAQTNGTSRRNSPETRQGPSLIGLRSSALQVSLTFVGQC